MLRKYHTRFAKSLVCASIFAALFMLAERVSAQSVGTYTSTSSTTWLTAGNWSTSAVPGSADIAQFSTNTAPASQCVINLNTPTTHIQPVGAVSVLSSRGANLAIGNSSTTIGGFLQLNGATVNSVANTIISNKMAATFTLSLNPTAGGTFPMMVTLGSSLSGGVIQGGGGTTSALGSTTTLTTTLNATSSQLITYLGGGTYDAVLNTGGINGGTLNLRTTNTFSGGITVGDNSGSPTYGNGGTLQIDAVGAFSNTATNNIVINKNSQLVLNVAGTYNTSALTTTVNGIGTQANSGAIRIKANALWTGNIVLGSDAMFAPTTGNTFSVTGTVTGANVLQLQGSGTTYFGNSGNTWGSTQIGNGTALVPSGGSFSTGDLYFNQTSTNTPVVQFNNTAQLIGTLTGSFSGTAGSNKLQINGTRLTINQTANATFGAAATFTSTITGTGSVVKSGANRLTLLATTADFSGGLKISQGELRFNPLTGFTMTNTSPDTLDGGTLGTNGIGANTALTLSTLALTNNSTIDLDTTAHRINFSASNSIVWTSGKTLTITNWTGSYAGGAAGTKGRIFFGSSTSALSATQLAQIRFYDGSSYYPAILLSTGELVPTPTITTTVASYGPFCNGVSNPLSVAFTTSGTFGSSTFSVQLSNASGTFPDATSNIIGTGTSSPISASIGAGTVAGTYRVRVINAGQTILGNDNGSNIVLNPTPSSFSLSPATASIFTGQSRVLTFSGTSGDVIAYSWTGGGTATTTVGAGGTVTVAVTPSVAGTYTYAITSATSAAGCTNSSPTGSIQSVLTVTNLAASVAGATAICSGVSTNLTFTGTPSTTVTYGDGTTAGLTTLLSAGGSSTVSVTPSATTTYTLTSVTSGTFTATVSGSTTVTVNPLPTSVSASASPNPVCNGSNLTLTGNATDAATYAWSGSAGYSSTTQSPVFAATTASGGIYTFTATTAAGCSVTSVTATVSVNPTPSPTLSPATASVFTGSSQVLTFSGVSGDVITYSWTGGGPATTTIGAGGTSTVSVTPVSAGSYTYAITSATSAAGCVNAAPAGSIQSVITSADLPTASISGSASICPGGNTNLTFTGTAGATVTYGNGTTAGITTTLNGSGSTTVSVSPVSTTTYTLTSVSSGTVVATATGSVTITVNPLPSLVSASASPNPVCNGSNLTLTGNATGAATYVWSGPAGYSSTTQSPVFAATSATAGIYTFTATTALGCSVTSVTATVSLNPTPVPSLSPATASLITSLSQDLTFSGASGDVITYSWTGGGPANTTIGAGGTSTVSVTPSSAGSYTYAITSATSAAGCVNSSPTGSIQSVLTVTNPTASISGSTTICDGSSATLTFNGTPNATVTYDDGTTSGLTALLDGAGTATVSVTPGVGATIYSLTSVTPFGGSDITVSGNATIIVNPLPGTINGALTVCVGATTTLTDLSSGTWSTSGSVATIGSASGVVTGSSAGTATIVFTASGCTTSAVVTVNPVPSISAISGASSVCAGSNISLSDATASGVWSSTSANATIDGTGGVNGVTAGTTTISYTVTSLGCSAAATRVLTINALTSAGTITGSTSVLLGSTTTLSDATASASGTWSSTNTAVGTVGSTTGVVAGISLGTTTISYSVTGVCGTVVATLNVTVIPVPPYSVGNITVLQQGNGTETLSANGNSLFVKEIKATDGSTVQTVAITNTGSNALIESGAAASEGLMSRAMNGKFLAIPGYSANIGGTVSVSAASSASIPRAVGKVDAFGAYSFVKSSTTFCTANNFRSVASDGGNNFWCGGATGGLNLFVVGGSDVAGVYTVAPSNLRTIKEINNQLYFSTGSATIGIYSVNPSLPTSTGATATLMISTAGSPYGFAFNSAADICYVADDGTTTAAGVKKYTRSGSTWTLQYTINADANNGCRSIAADFSGASPVIYVTTQQSSANKVVKIVDGGSVGTATVTTIATAPAGTRYTSLDFAPFSATISGGASFCGTGSSTISFTGSPNATMTYSVNGVAASPVTFGATGTYTVSTGTITSSATYVLGSVTDGTITQTIGSSVTITINPTPAPTLSPATASVATGTSQALVFSGNAGDVVTYTWTGGGPATTTIGAGGTSTVNVTPATAGTYTYAITSATSAAGCVNAAPTGSIQSVLTAVDVPFATISGGTSICNDGVSSANILFTGNAGSTVTYGDGTSSGLTILMSGTLGSGSGTATLNVTPAVGVTTYTLTSVTSGTVTTTVSGSTAVTVNPLPSAISGSLSICNGTSTTLTDAFSGTWSSLNTGVATVGSASGVVTSVATGTATIVFTSTAGCTTSSEVTVNAAPTVAAITGAASVCVGATTTLSDVTGSGVWSSANTAVGSVDASGNVTGVSAGTTTISYTVTTLGCSTTVTTNISAVALPTVNAITGTTTIFTSGTTNLTDATTGGTWSSTNTGVATVGTNGLVSGLSAGTTIISYTLTNICGSVAATVNVTVNAAPTVFSRGNLVVSQVGDGTAALTSASAPVKLVEYATSGAATGYVLPMPTTGTYSLTNSGSATSEGAIGLSAERDRIIVAGYNAPAGIASITGTAGSTYPRELVSVSITGSYTQVATSTTVYSANNIRGGTASGSNFYGGGPTSAAITLFPGTTISGTNTRYLKIFNGQLFATSGSSPVGIYSVGVGIPTTSATAVTALAAVYTVTTGAASPYGFSFSPDRTKLYIADDGSTTGGIYKFVLSGSTYAFDHKLTSTASRDLTVDYSGSNPVIYATNAAGSNINSLTDVGTGTVTVTSIATAPTNTAFRGIIFSPACYAGVTTLSAPFCAGGNGQVVFTGNPTGVVSYSVTGGSTTTATLDATGSATVTLTALSSTSTVNLISINTAGCSSATVSGSTVVTVNPLPTVGATGGGGVICSGATAALSGTGAVSYSWTGGITNGVAFVPTTGTNSYTVTGTDANGCSNTATTTLTVNALPTVGTTGGGVAICTGATATLSGTGAVSYSWTGGITNGVAFTPATGTTSYTVTGTDANGCSNTAVATVTVNALPTVGSTGGGVAICTGATATLSGTGAVSYSWTGGITNGVAFTPATGTISYTVTGTDANGCSNTAVATVTVNALPTVGSTGGGIAICAGATATLSGTGAVSYSWTGGITNGVAFTPATGTNSYTLTGTNANGCSNTAVAAVTVNALPTVGTTGGGVAICTGATATLSGTGAVSYSWTGGITNGVAFTPATGTTSYTVTGTDANGCSNTAVAMVTVNALPTVGTTGGGVAICTGATATLSGTGAVSYSWTGGITNGVGFVPTTGTNSYTVIGTDANGCSNTATTTVTVNPLPVAGSITGTATVCTGFTTNLTDATAGGTWSSTSPSVGSVDASGVVTGLAVGTTTISYTVTNSCGTAAATTVVTVNLSPDAGTIAGTATVCAGATTNLTDVAAGGTWSSSTPSIGTVDASGVVTGITAGTTTISYSVTTACGSVSATSVVTVNPLPVAGTITGTATVCTGFTTNLTDATAGGTWSSTSPSVGSVDASGVVTGLAVGTTTISYTVTNGCGTVAATTVVTVNLSPDAGSITGTATVCAGATTNLTDATAGGAWSSSTPSIGTVDASGVVTGITAGTTTISYSVTTACGSASATSVVTVNATNAGTITGASSVALSADITLTDAVSGGTWSASNANATVTGGLVHGVSNGTVTISYAVSGTCGIAYATKVITVGASVAPITGNLTVCNGLTTQLTDATSGGTWSSSNVLVATVGTSGIVTGAAGGSGTATISYTFSGVSSTVVVTLNVNPSGIGGAEAVCTGSSITLSNFTSGGTWSSTSGLSVTNGTTTTTVTGITAGVNTVTYSLSTGCFRTYGVTVNSSPLPISGNLNVCIGTTTTLTDATSGGLTWTSSTTSVATVNAAGVVTGVSAGTSTITFALSSGCTAKAVVTVTAAPAAITNNTAFCQGSSITLSDATSGGTWSSSNLAVGTIDASSGTVAGIAPGTATITYALAGAGCRATTVITVNPSTSAGTITGTGTACVGATTSLTDAVTGGTWSSTATGVASISSMGVVTGVSAGTATISYSITNICGVSASTVVVTINATAVAGTITGTGSVCVGFTTSLTDLTSGGVWSTGASSIATVGTDGTVTGVANGTARISYTVTNSCGSAYATSVVTVNTFTAGSISGPSSVIAGLTISLTDAVTGGVWSASNANATVNPTGVVTGVTAGTLTISYTVTNSCGVVSATQLITVAASSTSSIAGVFSVCNGMTTALTDATPGGTWSSSNPLIASVGTSGIVTGAVSGSGTTTISYIVAGVPATVVVTLNPNPSGIGGSTSVCTGSSVTMSDFTSGGTWTSTAGVSVTNGTTLTTVTGVSAGLNTVTYSLSTGCYRTFNITVNTPPAAISGNQEVCVGYATTLSDVTTGGISWSSSTTSVATVTASGSVMGVSAGTTNITYTLATGCRATTTVTVYAVPAAITNNAAFCQGSSITLSDATTGGTWSSSNLAVGTIDASTGAVAGIAPGNATITYAFAGVGCRATAVVTINAASSAGTISGTQTVCVGTTTTFADPIIGGAWSSTATTIATVSPMGVVRGITAGTATISYTITNICGTSASSVVVTVNPAPDAGTVTGTGTVCVGLTTSLTDLTSGGIWISAMTSVAAVGTDGTVTGVAAGTARISYTVTNSCGSVSATSVVTVSAFSAGTISGASSVIAGLTITLSDAVSGGVWSATNANATISPAGVVTGVSAGVVTISYTVTNGCGTIAATKDVTVNASTTSGIIGTLSVCNGMTTALTDLTPGGTWTSTNPSVATVGTSGIVTGAASGSGTATISYTVGGVPATVVVTLNANPSSIGGTSSVCNGLSVTLSDLTSGGTWTSTSGVSVTTGTTVTTVTGTSVGTSTVSYTLATGCYKTYNVTVKALPSAILGNLNVCGVGGVTFLSDLTAGTSWTIAPATVATVSPSGRVYGASTGTATVTYNAANGCITTAVATVNALVTVAPILGATNVGHGLTITLSDATASGVWSSSNATLGSVDASGNVTGVGTSGTVTISYSVSYAGGGCTAYATKPITVHTPAPHGATVSSAVNVSAGCAITLNEEVFSGTWSSSNDNVATVDGGVVIAIAPGITNITHTVENSQGDVTTTVTPVIVSVIAMDARVIPNPNAGAFAVKGTLGSANDEEVTFEVTDVLGQVVYKSNVTALGGKINEAISLSSSLANGMYMLNVHTNNDSKVIHFVIEK